MRNQLSTGVLAVSLFIGCGGLPNGTGSTDPPSGMPAPADACTSPLPTRTTAFPSWQCKDAPYSFYGFDLATNKTVLAESMRTWARLKASHGENYVYVTNHPCGECCFQSQTRIRYTNGVATSRDYLAWSSYVAGTPVEQYVFDTWTESAGTVGTHTTGDRADSMDALYRACEDVLARDPKEHTFLLSLDPDGLLQQCLTQQIGYADDTGSGVSLCSFEFTSP